MLEYLSSVAVVVGFVAVTLSAVVAVKWFVAFLGRHGLAGA